LKKTWTVPWQGEQGREAIGGKDPASQHNQKINGEFPETQESEMGRGEWEAVPTGKITSRGKGRGEARTKERRRN